MGEHLTIAIDGPAGAGKSTIAKMVAKHYSIIYVDTGAMYRSVALHMIRSGVDMDDEKAVVDQMSVLKIELAFEEGSQKVFLNGTDVTEAIREQAVGESASKVSRYMPVREKLVSMQQAMAKGDSLVMDGRDIGTHVLTDADVKIYLSADVNVRAKRRYDQLIEMGNEGNVEAIAEEIKDRDYRDTHREISPLRQADDAVLIDTSQMNQEEVLSAIIQLVERSR